MPLFDVSLNVPGPKLWTGIVGSIGALDTGANAIPAGHGTLIIQILAQSSTASATEGFTARVNNDSGSNYDAGYTQGSSSGSSGTNVGQTFWSSAGLLHGTGGTASYASAVTFIFPFYDNTTFNKSGWLLMATADGTAANNRIAAVAIGWRSTAAINEFMINSTSGLSVGSRMTIYGTE